MSIKFNDQLLMWALGVIQPATPSEVIGFLQVVYSDIDQWPDDKMLGHILANWIERGYVLMLNKKHRLLSLTAHANSRMDVKLRRQRDKARLTLLREMYDASLESSGAVEQDLDGVSPSSEGSTASQEGSWPVNSGSEPSRTESTRLRSRIYWPRVSEQLNSKVGLGFHASDIPSYRYRYCSFPTLKLLQQASAGPNLEQDMTLSQLALAIGVSPRLLTSFTHKSENHYRTFVIGKKGGGEREISSPRFFLKSVQYWIKSYVLCHLDIHWSCHAYLRGKSIITNAQCHVGKTFVANIDIEDFFGSITRDHVFSLLRGNGVGEKLSSVVASLVTYRGCIPQGAPTSPDISNALLYKFDEAIADYTQKLGLTYSRYADDITISGDSRGSIESAIRKCSALLESYDMRLKDKKTRIASSQASQRVTGLVVNEKIQPPREYQRRIRAIFHRAFVSPEGYTKRIDELRGYLSFLSSFEALRDSRHLRRYRVVISKVLAQAENDDDPKE